MTEPALNFTGRDYSAELERLDALGLQDVPELTDLNHSDAGKALKRLQARQTDLLNANVDRAAESCLVPYFRFKQDGIDIGRTVDYLPTLASAASTRLRIDRKAGVVGAISIPKYSAMGRADGVEYLTAAAAAIAEAENSIEVNAIQGVVVEAEIEPSDWIDDHDWTGHLRFALPRGLAAGTVELWQGGAGAEIYWSEVDSFWRSRPTDRHFLLELNGEDDSVWLVLGDGTAGSLPPSSEDLHIRFVVCAEALGNCGSGVIYLVPDGLSDSVTAANIESATGGAPAESTESIRRSIPAVTNAQRRMVTVKRVDGWPSDYEALLEHLPGVLHVQSLDRNDSLEWPHMYVVLYVVPEGGGPMSSLLKEQIWAYCGERGHLGPWKERYILKDAVEIPVNVSVRIGVLQGYSSDSVRTAVIAALNSIFAPEDRTIGGSITFTELHAAASAVAGVSWVEFDAPMTGVTIANGQIPAAGAITVTIT